MVNVNIKLLQDYVTTWYAHDITTPNSPKYILTSFPCGKINSPTARAMGHNGRGITNGAAFILPASWRVFSEYFTKEFLNKW